MTSKQTEKDKKRLQEMCEAMLKAMKKMSSKRRRNPKVVDWRVVGNAAVKNSGKDGLW